MSGGKFSLYCPRNALVTDRASGKRTAGTYNGVVRNRGILELDVDTLA